ncbi:hypothetical protein SLA2020_392750 [Shorea laevis]
MKRKLDTRFPAARIKKIMQADEDVGKIALAVPLLVSKALELFLQDLCDRTYEITLKKGVKTLNSFHLKQCVQTFNVFDFLKETVGKVTDLGGSEAADEDRSVCKRRKVVDDDNSDCDDEPKKSRVDATGNLSGRGRGRSRGRGRGRSRGRKIMEQETVPHHENFEDDPDTSHQQEANDLDFQRLYSRREPDEAAVQANNNLKAPVRNFDLNVGLDENGDQIIPVSAPASPIMKTIPEIKHEEYPGWSLSEIDKMAIDSTQLTNFNGRIDEDEEDYDEDSE